MWLSRITQQAAIDASNRPTVDLVVSFCNEPESTVERVRSAATLLRTAGCEARTLIYCKCEWRSWCNRRLDNVGREGHTHLHHIAEHYGFLADLTFFVNGGFEYGKSRKGVRGKWFNQKDMVFRQVLAQVSRGCAGGASAMQATYSDGFPHGDYDPCPYVGNGGCTGTLALADGRAEALARGRQYCQSGGLATYCSDGSRRCTLCTRMREVFGVKCDGADCACDDIGGSCYWKGKQAQSTEMLTLSSPRSFLAWACHHWSVTPEQLQRVQWQWTGTFAVGAQLVRMRPRLAYSDARDALAAGGRGGGVAGHFQERLWRAIFLSSLGGQCEPAAAHNDSRTPELTRKLIASAMDARDGKTRLRPAKQKRPDAQAPPEYDVGSAPLAQRSVGHERSSRRRTRRAAAKLLSRGEQEDVEDPDGELGMVKAQFNVTFEEYVGRERLLPMNFQGEDLSGARGGTAQDCYDRCALNFVLGGECRAFTFLTDANAKGKRCWLKRPTYARGRRYPNPGTLSGVLETRGGCLVPDVAPPPQLLPAPEADPVPGQSAVRVSDLLEKVLPPLGPIRVQVPQHVVPRFTCLVLNLASREDRWRSIQHVLRCAAPSVCRSVERAVALTPQSAEFTAAREGAHAAHLRHFGSGAAARFLTLNITLTRLLARGAAAFPALIIEDDAVLHPRFDEVLPLAWSHRPPRAGILQLGIEGNDQCRLFELPEEFRPAGGEWWNGGDWWQNGYGWGEPAVAYTRAGAQLLVELMSAPQWVRSSAEARAPADGASPPIWCDGVPATEACAPRPHGERFLRHYGPDTCACRRFDKPDVWTAFTAAKIAEPGAFVFFAADLRWGPTYKSIEKHRVGGGGILQCGLAMQAQMGSDQRPDQKRPNRKAAGAARPPAREITDRERAANKRIWMG